MQDAIPDEKRGASTLVRAQPVVVIQRLVKQFGKLRAVNDLNLTIQAGETFGLIGPNGSGKTTLMVILLFVVFVLRVHYSGNLALVFLVSALLTIGSVNLGIFLSTFAQNEFQVVQFIPLVFGIQVFLSGIFWPVAQLPQLLQPIAYILPLTYANQALRGVMLKSFGIGEIAWQLTALLVFALVMILLSSLTIRREVA